MMMNDRKTQGKRREEIRDYFFRKYGLNMDELRAEEGEFVGVILGLEAFSFEKSSHNTIKIFYTNATLPYAIH